MEDRQCKDVKELVFTSICLILNLHVGCLITDSCSETSPRGSAKVKPAWFRGQEVIHRCPESNFSLLTSTCAAVLWCVMHR